MSQPPNGPSVPHVARHLEHALTLPAHERERWLTHLETTDPGLAQLVQELLAGAESAMHARAPTELRSAGLGAMPPGLQEGAVLGGYRLVREIGYGGMSSVWLAERCDGQLQREVALKLPLVGPARLHLAERFRRERDILATLTHPNIARLYDAGISSSGQPFLAMEYVEGSTLVNYCETGRLTIRERLQVMLQVLEAVQFAHAKLIVHRDLKPSNILVNAQGRVVLLDFGIAKLLSEDAVENNALTQMAGRPFTPDYASPEQITGLPLSTATDIYSLGVLLYELLTGARPYGADRSSLAQLQQAILTHDPARPSQLALTDAVAESRRCSVRKLASTLTGDLDTIILKALKKEPGERYASVDAFAQDIRNYLQRLPVSARPDGRWYRLNRFVLRHKLPVAAAAVTLLAIVGGAVVALWQMQIAAAERDRAFSLASRNAAVTEFMGTLITEAAASDKPITISEMLARGERLARTDTAVAAESRAAVLGMIATHYNALGDESRTLALLDDALALLDNTADPGMRSQLRCARAMHIADLGQQEQARRIIEQELASLDADAENAAYCLLYRSFIAQDGSNPGAALRDALAAFERFRAAPRTATVDAGLFLGAIAAGYTLNGRNREADDFYRQALQSYVAMGRERGPNAIQLRNNWAVVNSNAGVPKRSVELYDETLSIVAERDPGSQPPPYVVTNRARALSVIGRYRESIQAYQQAQRLLTAQHNPMGESLSLLGLAFVAIEMRDAPAAARHLQQLAALSGGSVPENAPTWLIHTLLRARLEVLNARPAQARTLFERALATQPRNSNLVDTLLGMADTELLAGNGAAAGKNARRALAIAESLQGGVPYSNRTGLAWLAVACASQQMADPKQALPAFEAAVLHLANTVDADHPALVRAREGLAQIRSQ